MAEPRQEIRFAVAPDGVRIAWSRVGSGPPLVKAAHWLSHLEHDWQSSIWRPWLDRLARRHELIRYDERGCGLSDRRASGFDFDDWVADLEAVVEASGHPSISLVGMSQGGAVAIAYAARHPERVHRLVLYGAYARGVRRRDPTEREVEAADTLLDLVRLGWGRENPAFAEVFASLFIPGAGPERRREFTELQRLSASPETALAMVTGFQNIDVEGLARQVRAPTLVLHGRDDARVPFDEGRHLASLIPDARLVPLDTSSHILLDGDPALDTFTAEVDAFLAGEPPPSVPPTTLDALTRRELEVLGLIAQGLDNSAIARRLSISPSTVRNHITRIFAKLSVERRAQAIVLAREAGLGRS